MNFKCYTYLRFEKYQGYQDWKKWKKKPTIDKESCEPYPGNYLSDS